MQLFRRAIHHLFPTSALAVGTQVHEWKVLQPLGQGRNGALYKVERAGRISVMKWLATPGGPQQVLANQELTCLRMLPRPSFPRLEAYGRWPDQKGTAFLVLEHVPGLTLTQWCRRPGPTPRDVLQVFHRLMRAVTEMNDRGMCYPSLTCDDVVIRERNQRPVITELGGAVTFDRPPTELEMSLDVRAVGGMLYEVLTHQQPGLYAPPPHVVNPRVPRELSELAMRLL
jgi:serine/threonine-protein kinase